MISIIVPAYNLKDYILRTLNSILAQTYKELEIIVVDDGSTDGTAAVLDEYAAIHPQIRVIHQSNGGVTSARLRGIAEASSEWIGFVDGDDEIEPDMYERLMENALKYGADISHCGYQMVFPDGRVNYFHNTGHLAKQDKITALRELLSGSRIEPGLWNKLFHKTLFHSLLHGEAVPLDIKINEDLLMNYYLFSAAEQTVFEDWCPYHYIVRSTSASRAKLNEHKIYDPIRVKEIIRQTAPDEIYADVQRAYVNTCINVYQSVMCAGKSFYADKKKVRRLLRQETKTFGLLGKKRAAMAWMIVVLPAIYKTLYSCYSRFFQKSVYS